MWKDLYQSSVDFSHYKPLGQNGGGGDDGEILKPGSRAQAFCPYYGMTVFPEVSAVHDWSAGP